MIILWMNQDFKKMSRGMLAGDKQDEEFLEYWLSRPIEERLDEIERLRKIQHGADYATTSRLSRSDLRIERRKG